MNGIKMNVVTNRSFFILTNTLKAGGAERQSIYLTNALLQAGYDVTLVVYYGNQFDNHYRKLTEEFSGRVVWLQGNHISKLFKLYRLFKQKKNVTIISYLATTNVINAVIGTLGGAEMKIGGVRNAVIKKNKLRIQRFLHNYVLTHTVSNNHAAYNYLVDNGFESEKLSVIPNCISNIPAYFERDKQKKIVKILSLSRFEAQKDLITALKAVKILKNELKAGDFEYLLAGYGAEEQKLRDFIKENELDAHVKVLIKPNVDEVFREADIFINTSLIEGTSNSIMEAMTYGLPVVATNAGDAKYLVENNVSGYICRIGDAAEVAQGLQKLVESSALRSDFGVVSHAKIQAEFSQEKMRDSYISIVKKKE